MKPRKLCETCKEKPTRKPKERFCSACAKAELAKFGHKPSRNTYRAGPSDRGGARYDDGADSPYHENALGNLEDGYDSGS